MKRMKHAEQRLNSHDSKNEKEGLVAEEEEEEEEEVLITSDLRLDPDPGFEWNTFLGSIPPTDLS